jgi:cytochrome c oxidase subunit 2
VGTGVSWQSFVLVGGVGVPGVTLLALLAYALVVGERLLPHPASDVLRVRVTGQQWHWSFSYDHAGGTRTSTGVMHIPARRPVDIHVTSSDVIHSFWIPQLAGKIDATPGHTTVLRLKADRPGNYHGICAEFCGTGHTGMEFRVLAHPESDYFDEIARLTEGQAPHHSVPSRSERVP